MRNQVLLLEVVSMTTVTVVAVDPAEIFTRVLAAEILVAAIIALAVAVWGRRLL